MRATFNHPLMFKHSYKAIIHLLYIERLTINLVLLAFQINNSTTHAHKHTWIVTPQHKNQQTIVFNHSITQLKSSLITLMTI